MGLWVTGFDRFQWKTFFTAAALIAALCGWIDAASRSKKGTISLKSPFLEGKKKRSFMNRVTDHLICQN